MKLCMSAGNKVQVRLQGRHQVGALSTDSSAVSSWPALTQPRHPSEANVYNQIASVATFCLRLCSKILEKVGLTLFTEVSIHLSLSFEKLDNLCTVMLKKILPLFTKNSNPFTLISLTLNSDMIGALKGLKGTLKKLQMMRDFKSFNMAREGLWFVRVRITELWI